MKQTYILYLYFFFYCTGLLGQNNLAPNPSFEQGSPDPTNHTQLEGQLDNWFNLNTSDWYKEGSYDGTYIDGNGNTQILSAHSGVGYVGFGGCEGAQAKLNSTVDREYAQVSFWWSPREAYDSEINVYLLANKAPPNALSPQNNCFTPQIDFEYHAVVTVNAAGSDAIHVPGTWYFFVSEPFLVSQEPYEWVAFKGENQIGALGSPNYIYLDDITVTAIDPCDHPCSFGYVPPWETLDPATLDPNDPDGFRAIKITGSGTTSFATHLVDFMFLQNVTYVDFEVYNQ